MVQKMTFEVVEKQKKTENIADILLAVKHLS